MQATCFTTKLVSVRWCPFRISNTDRTVTCAHIHSTPFPDGISTVFFFFHFDFSFVPNEHLMNIRCMMSPTAHFRIRCNFTTFTSCAQIAHWRGLLVRRPLLICAYRSAGPFGANGWSPSPDLLAHICLICLAPSPVASFCWLSASGVLA